MTALNLNQAARTCGKSKSAILEAIRNGRLSANRNDKNEWQIDPSELFRVYPYKIENNKTEQPTEQQNRHQPATEQQNSVLFKELLENERKERERERAQMQETINDLRKRLDEETEERRQLTKLISYQPEKTENSLFKKIFKN